MQPNVCGVFGRVWQALRFCKATEATASPSFEERRKRRAEWQARYDADTERLKQLGGTDRTPEEEQEFRDILLRNPGRCTAYFENRLWEKRFETA